MYKCLLSLLFFQSQSQVSNKPSIEETLEKIKKTTEKEKPLSNTFIAWTIAIILILFALAYCIVNYLFKKKLKNQAKITKNNKEVTVIIS